MEILKFIDAKGKNKRIYILLCKENDSKFFIIHTKTLQDFRRRIITETKNTYSVETFAALGDLINAFLDAGPVKNKLIHKELSQIQKFNAQTNINQ